MPEMSIYSNGKGFETVHNFNEDVNTFSVTDSLLILNQNKSNLRFPINDVSKISIRDGNKFWTGAGIGASIGFILGFIGGGFFHLGGQAVFNLQYGLLVGSIAAVPFGLVGGWIGAFFPNYENSSLFKSNESKYKAVIRIFRKNRITD